MDPAVLEVAGFMEAMAGMASAPWHGTGHLGQDKTLNWPWLIFYWPGIHVNSCHVNSCNWYTAS